MASRLDMTERLELRSEDRSASLTLAFVEAEDITGSVAANVEVRAGEFAGAVPSVWFQRDALDEFAVALSRFEQERSGSVSVCNLGVPDATNEFKMSLAARSGGHASLVVSILRVRYAPSGLSPLELTARFDVDGGDLGQFVHDWRDLFAERTRPPAI